jgi:hypothetical protein
MNKLAALFLVQTLGLAAGCGIDSRFALGSQCSLSSECDAPLVCRLERCRKQCAASRDCAAGLRCLVAQDGSGVCQLEEETTCLLDEDCPSTLICNPNNMQCGNECEPEEEGSSASRDCPSGELCVDSRCIPPTDEPDCILTSDCDPPLICRERQCVVECAENIDCTDEPGQLCVAVPGCSDIPGVQGPCACKSPCDTAECPNLGTECRDCPDAIACAAHDDGTEVLRYCERVAATPP